MAAVSGILIILIFFLLAACAALIWLQVFLSKKDNKWLGLILPFTILVISVIFMLVMILGGTAYMTQITSETITENGEIVTEVVSSERVPIAGVGAIVIGAGVTFLLLNIPTVILLIIYFGIRDSRRKRMALDKMSAHDIE